MTVELPHYLMFRFDGDDNPPAQVWEHLEAGESLDDLGLPLELVERVRADHERYVAACEQERGQARERRVRQAGIPAKDVERIIAGELEETAAVGYARQALREGWTLLVLSGPPGVGKTTAAGLWLAEQSDRGGLMCIDAHRLSRWPRYDGAQMAKLEDASALVIDDLGAEYDDKPGAFRSLLDGLLNVRYADCQPTLVTTNLPATSFCERYGERIVDRIREAGRFMAVAGPSLRGRRR